MIAMRRQYSPEGMLHADGSINQDFFKPKRVVIIDDKKWGAAERDLLYKVGGGEQGRGRERGKWGLYSVPTVRSGLRARRESFRKSTQWT